MYRLAVLLLLLGCTAAVSPVAAASPITTVQAPQSPSLQPSFVPVLRAFSRSQSSTVRVGAASATATTAPRCRKRMGRGSEVDRAVFKGRLIKVQA